MKVRYAHGEFKRFCLAELEMLLLDSSCGKEWKGHCGNPVGILDGVDLGVAVDFFNDHHFPYQASKAPTRPRVSY